MEAAALAALLGLEVRSVVGLAPGSLPAPGGAWAATVVCGICPHRLVTIDPVDPLQAGAHRLFQIVAGLAVFRIAPGDIFLLLSPQRTPLPWGHLLGGESRGF